MGDTLEQTRDTETLYDRLGGETGVATLVDRIVDLHLQNPTVAPRFAAADTDRARAMAKEFFAAGAGGPVTYTGKSMPEAHRGMNISEEEFVAVVDDMMQAMADLGYGQIVRDEVLVIAYSRKSEVVHV